VNAPERPAYDFRPESQRASVALPAIVRPRSLRWPTGWHVWPRSLAARTALVLLLGLAVVQVAGLTIHALDRMELQRLAQMRDIASRVMSLYRSVALTPPDQRDIVVQELNLKYGTDVRLDPGPPATLLPLAPVPLQRELRVNMQLVPMPQQQRPREFMLFGGPRVEQLMIGLRLPEGRWLNIAMRMPPPRPWHSLTFLLAFVVMTLAAALLTLWAVRRLTEPVRTLAAAAEALGRDVNAPPLPETGPSEVAVAAAAFNTMAARIRRFVQDRTFMLTAMGHDLRTPITRMKLRAEFVDDDDLRRKFLADLDDLESMVASTLAFGRDVASDEAMSSVDLAGLARTVLDEAADARPDMADRLGYEGPGHLAVRLRSLSVKRALTNLVANALAYGGAARVTLTAPAAGGQRSHGAGGGMLTLLVDDDGPGIPEVDLERVFQPFLRLESSRNRETGGTGLGLPIARNIMRAHGGDVTLVNRPGGGVRAVVSLPV
jgi:signal transduction histidine kinase